MNLDYRISKRDGRHKYHAVIDVETSTPIKGSFAKPLVYDIGVTIASKNGKIVFSKQYVIEEIFDDVELMKNAYYFEKRPKYIKALALEKAHKMPFIQARDEIIGLLFKYDVKVVAAYNYPFDRRAINETIKYLYPSIPYIYRPREYKKNGEPKKRSKDHETFFQKHFLHKEDLTELCIMSLACETIFKRKDFSTFCEENDFLTEKGNFQTTAEVAYRFLTDDPDFIEEHTGQDDTIIETYIMAECFKMNRKVKSGVLYNAWRLCQI